MEMSFSLKDCKIYPLTPSPFLPPLDKRIRGVISCPYED
jgi:hypothetical protein